jgi:hypothetical protein
MEYMRTLQIGGARALEGVQYHRRIEDVGVRFSCGFDPAFPSLASAAPPNIDTTQHNTTQHNTTQHNTNEKQTNSKTASSKTSKHQMSFCQNIKIQNN